MLYFLSRVPERALAVIAAMGLVAIAIYTDVAVIHWRHPHDDARYVTVFEGVVSGGLWFWASLLPMIPGSERTWPTKGAFLNSIAAAATAGAAIASLG